VKHIAPTLVVPAEVVVAGFQGKRVVYYLAHWLCPLGHPAQAMVICCEMAGMGKEKILILCYFIQKQTQRATRLTSSVRWLTGPMSNVE
jgi:hypothetical protein